MNPIVRNILAVIAGVIVGMASNIGILIVGFFLVPTPEGLNIMDPESIKAAIPQFKTYHYIIPLLAHASQAFFGALVASLIAKSHRLLLAMIIGVISLIGGIMNAFQIPAPFWFNVIDLVAYLPMAFLGWKLSGKE